MTEHEQYRGSVRGAVKRRREGGTTVLITSHHAEDIDGLCDTVCEIEQGRLAIVRK